MSNLEQAVIYIAGVIVITIILYYLYNYVWRLERKYDLICFMIGDLILMFFLVLLVFSKFEDVPTLLSSLFIAELTLALVWVELSKRPELKLGDFVPIILKSHTIGSGVDYKAGYHDEPPKPSTFLKIKEVSYKNLKFDEYFSFSVDLSNIGYQEIMVHEYVIYIDGKRQNPIPLGKPPYYERARLITQERYTIDMPSLYIKSAGFHKIHFQVIAATVKCSKEVWVFISKNFKQLRYLEMNNYKHLLSPLIKSVLKDP